MVEVIILLMEPRGMSARAKPGEREARTESAPRGVQGDGVMWEIKVSASLIDQIINQSVNIIEKNTRRFIILLPENGSK